MESLELLEVPADRDPAVEQALTNVLLEEVGSGSRGASLRLLSPLPMVSFGSDDRRQPRLAAAAGAARAHGHAPILRGSGGSAVVFGPHTVLFAFVLRRHPGVSPEQRFDAVATVLRQALAVAGCPVEIGETPGEYCPGAYSLHAGGRKVAGMGQRVTAHAALVEGVIVVEDAAATHETLVAVYEELERDWDPASVGALAQVAPAVSVGRVLVALASSLSSSERCVGERTMAAARKLAPALRITPSTSH